MKYGVTQGTGVDYVDSTGNIIWNRSTNSGYNYNITTLARDDASALYQKQAKSTNDSGGLVTIAIDSIFATNSGNTSTIDTDRSFMII